MVLWFSGTGNSRYVAQLLADRLGDRLVSLNERLRNGDTSPLHSDAPYVVVCPIYAGRIPRVVEQHLRRTDFSGSRFFYFLVTCGETAYTAAHYAKKLCQEKHLSYVGFIEVLMPYSYTARHDLPTPERCAKLVDAAGPRVETVAKAILAGQSLTGPGRMGTGMSDLFNPFFYPLYVHARAFTATDGCDHCGRCAQVCPLGNITLEDGKPRWGGACTHCMACINACPTQAIEYGAQTRGKPRYPGPEAYVTPQKDRVP